MHAERVLVVYYSRSGATKKVGDALGRELGGDVEELVDTRTRTGLLGYLRAGFDAALGRLTILRTVARDPSRYDLVIVGTPVWNGSMTPAIRTYLFAHKREIKRVAFFCTAGAGGCGRVFAQMSQVGGHAPVDVLAVHADDLAQGYYVERVHEFVDAIAHAPAA